MNWKLGNVPEASSLYALYAGSLVRQEMLEHCPDVGRVAILCALACVPVYLCQLRHTVWEIVTLTCSPPTQSQDLTSALQKL